MPKRLARAERWLALPIAVLATLLVADAVRASEQDQQIIAQSKISIERIVNVYDVYGSTAWEIRQSLDANRPLINDGRWDAQVASRINWHYPYINEGGICRAGPITTDVRINFTYPRWANAEHQSPQLIQEWERYMVDLQVHEDGHAQIWIEVASEISDTISNLTAPDCVSLEEAADKTGVEVIEKTKQRDEKYDKDTLNGKTQGAVFPR